MQIIALFQSTRVFIGASIIIEQIIAFPAFSIIFVEDYSISHMSISSLAVCESSGICSIKHRLHVQHCFSLLVQVVLCTSSYRR